MAQKTWRYKAWVSYPGKICEVELGRSATEELDDETYRREVLSRVNRRLARCIRKAKHRSLSVKVFRFPIVLDPNGEADPEGWYVYTIDAAALSRKGIERNAVTKRAEDLAAKVLAHVKEKLVAPMPAPSVKRRR